MILETSFTLILFTSNSVSGLNFYQFIKMKFFHQVVHPQLILFFLKMSEQIFKIQKGVKQRDSINLNVFNLIWRSFLPRCLEVAGNQIALIYTKDVMLGKSRRDNKNLLRKFMDWQSLRPNALPWWQTSWERRITILRSDSSYKTLKFYQRGGMSSSISAIVLLWHP